MQQEEGAIYQERQQSIGQAQRFLFVVRGKGEMLLEPHLIAPDVVAYFERLFLFNLAGKGG